jgi:hypothetical protein
LRSKIKEISTNKTGSTNEAIPLNETAILAFILIDPKGSEAALKRINDFKEGNAKNNLSKKELTSYNKRFNGFDITSIK